MSALLEPPRFTLEEWASMLRDPTKNKRYLACRLGNAVADYLSWKENEDGAATETLRTYEYDLARLAVTFPDIDETALRIEHLRQVRDLYPEGSRYKVTAVYKDFGKWLYEESRTETNASGRLRYPKKHKPAIVGLFTDEEKSAIVAAQKTIRDRVCVLLLLRAGIRKGELRQLQVQDLDLRERLILVRRGKGGKPRRVPVRGSLVRALDEFLLTEIAGLDRLPEPDDYILYPARKANQHAAGNEPNPKKPMAQSTAHRWWYRCLERAGVVEKNVSSGRKMHTTRHTYATDLGRANDWNMLAVQKNLGHSKLGTTVDTYTQFAYEDQEAAVELLPEIKV